MNLLMLLFLALPLLGNAYVFWRLGVMLPLTPLWKISILGGLFVVIIIAFILFARYEAQINPTYYKVVYELCTSWLIILLYLVIIFLLLDIGRLLHLVPTSWVVHSVKGSLSLCVFVVALFTYGYFNYKHKVRQELTLHTSKPLEQPLKLVLMSDLHLGYHNDRSELARWIDRVNAEKPDIVLIAGDIIDMSVRPLLRDNFAAEFHRLKAPVYACLGNHEYISGIDKSADFFKAAGIHLLLDSHAELLGINIVGRNDRHNSGRESLKKIMQSVDKHKFTILLDHQPYHLEEAEAAGVDFQFSGHTHHGQVWPISWITDALYENAFGHSVRGDTQYYVSSGMGIWGGKFRIGTVSEYIVAEIKH